MKQVVVTGILAKCGNGQYVDPYSSVDKPCGAYLDVDIEDIEVKLLPRQANWQVDGYEGLVQCCVCGYATRVDAAPNVLRTRYERQQKLLQEKIDEQERQRNAGAQAQPQPQPGS